MMDGEYQILIHTDTVIILVGMVTVMDIATIHVIATQWLASPAIVSVMYVRIYVVHTMSCNMDSTSL